MTALHWAALNGREAVVLLLLDAKATVDKPDQVRAGSRILGCSALVGAALDSAGWVLFGRVEGAEG